eukprot:jgi/Ulvmu1/11905/UM081_0064.1
MLTCFRDVADGSPLDSSKSNVSFRLTCIRTPSATSSLSLDMLPESQPSEPIVSPHTQFHGRNVLDWIPAASNRLGTDTEAHTPSSTASPFPTAAAAPDAWRHKRLSRAFYVLALVSAAQLTLTLQLHVPLVAGPAVVSSLLGLTISGTFLVASEAGMGEHLMRHLRMARLLLLAALATSAVSGAWLGFGRLPAADPEPLDSVWTLFAGSWLHAAATAYAAVAVIAAERSLRPGRSRPRP